MTLEDFEYLNKKKCSEKPLPNRTSLIEMIASKLGYDIDLLETYETSKLKQIWDNIKTVNVEASIEEQTDKNLTKYLLIGGCFLLVGIYLLKKM